MGVYRVIARSVLLTMVLAGPAHSLGLSDSMVDWICSAPEDRQVVANRLELVSGYGRRELTAAYFYECIDGYAITLSFTENTIGDMGRACAVVRIVNLVEG